MINGDLVWLNGISYIFQNAFEDNYIFIHHTRPSLQIPIQVFHMAHETGGNYYFDNLEKYEMKNHGIYEQTLSKEQTDADIVSIPSTTKDSGKRTTFDSGMVRDVDDEKIMWHAVLDGPMLPRWAMLLTRGKKKYPDSEDGTANWLKANGIAEWLRFRASAMRHFIQWFIGMDDEDHAAAIFFNVNGAEYVAQSLSERDTYPIFTRWRWLRQLLLHPQFHTKKDNQ